MDNCQRLYSVYSKCILYTALKQKYNIDYNFKLTPLNKRDIYLSDYYFTINKTNNDITKKCDIIRMHDSEDDIDIDELPDEAVYDENENVYCFYKYHICENNENTNINNKLNFRFNLSFITISFSITAFFFSINIINSSWLYFTNRC